MSIKIKYYYSACVGIITPDCSILCDPWFTNGIYDGSWYQFPKLSNPLDHIEKYNYIYISHIHPDHYDPVFLKDYLKLHSTTCLIAIDKHLIRAMQADGFKVFDNNMIAVGNTFIKMFGNDSGSVSDIDTALAIRWKTHAVVNMNDNMPNQKQLSDIISFTRDKIDIALLGYTGAGPYPQTYYDLMDPALPGLAEEKKQNGFKRYLELDKALNATINIPFAGQYILGGRLVNLNQYRGIADAVEVLEFDPKAIVLEELAEIDTENFIPTGQRILPYEGMESYLRVVSYMHFDYEKLNIEVNKIPYVRLLRKAYERAMASNEYKGDDYYIIIKLLKGYYYCNIDSNNQKSYFNEEFLPQEPYSLIEIDLKYLFGLIVGIYHWNNAEVGSHFKTKRVPDIFNRDVQRFLNFFYV